MTRLPIQPARGSWKQKSLSVITRACSVSARRGAWPSIAAHGLLTAAEIVSTSGLSAEEQGRILSRPRPGRLAVSHPRLGTVFLSDQDAAPATHPAEIAARPERG